MNYTTYAQSIRDLNLIKDSDLKEVIVSNKDLSRYATNNNEKLIELCRIAKDFGLKVILEWDILIVEDDFSKSVDAFNLIPTELYDVIRVQDPGVLEYVLEETQKQIHFSAETGNHNITGLKTWINYIGTRLDRVILSIELNKTKLKEYREIITCELELLVLGKILLFYSPRKLLSALLPEDDEKKTKQIVSDEYLTAIGESEESPHKGFPLIENKHGTFMFHIKDLFLLDKYTELSDINFDFLRLDLRDKECIELLPKISSFKTNDEFTSLKADYPNDVIRGYFQINKSDVLFKKLKNYRIQRKDLSYIGEVIEASKGGAHIVIDIKSDQVLKLDAELKYITPEGKELFCKVHSLRDITLVDCESKGKGELALVNYMSGVWVKSQVYLEK
jgi:putative protease